MYMKRELLLSDRRTLQLVYRGSKGTRYGRRIAVIRKCGDIVHRESSLRGLSSPVSSVNVHAGAAK